MKTGTALYGAIGYTYEYRIELLQRLLLPLIVLIAAGQVLEDSKHGVLTTASIAIISLTYSLIAVSTHRIILLGPDAVPKWGLYIPGKREILFIAYTILMFLLVMIPMTVIIYIPAVGFILGVLLMTYILGRLSLVFPAIATDRKWSFSDSWNATNGHEFSMIVVVGIFPMLIGIPERLLAMVPYTTVLTSIISVITLVLTIAALSVAFKVIAAAEEGR